MKKRMNCYLAVMLVIVSIFLLAGCGGRRTTSVEIAPTEKNEKYLSREEFDAAWHAVEDKRDGCLNEFAENPVITEELLDTLYSNEEEYAKLSDLSKELSSQDYHDVSILFSSKEIRDGIETIAYHEYFETLYSSYFLGIYTLNLKEKINVEWVQNLEVFWENEDERCYEVIAPEEDAYLLLEIRNSFMLVRIESNSSLQEYTIELFDEAHEILQNQRDSLLGEVSQKHEITESFVGKMQVNEKRYSNLIETAKYLSLDGHSSVMNYLEDGIIHDGLLTLSYDKNYFGKYYRYVDGVYTVYAVTECFVEWSQNVEEDSEPKAYNRNRIYTVENPKEEAYILVRGYGLRLIRILPAETE